jgi:hypothetical protein
VSRIEYAGLAIVRQSNDILGFRPQPRDPPSGR